MGAPAALLAAKIITAAAAAKQAFNPEQPDIQAPTLSQGEKAPVAPPVRRRRRGQSLADLGPAPLSLLETGAPKLLGS